MKQCATCGTEWPDETKFCPNDGTTLRSASGGAEMVGSVVADRYHILKKLGEGGMGAVYLGEHVKMGRMSAIKVLTQAMVADPDAVARFNREAANAARITHPNVCAIYDFGETPEGLIYLAMEFIEGDALTTVLEREGGRLAAPRAAAIIQQAGDALQAAHDLGIVHRDLKPDNIMITEGRDGGDVVKVVDFGIAKAMGGNEGQTVTKTGLVVGTPEYMSPEQLSGDTLDGRSDIYSLGLVFFRIITGTLPFQADSAQETMIKRLTDDPLKLNEAFPEGSFPPRLQAVVDNALQRMPGERSSSAAAFAREVAAAVDAMDAQPAPPAATESATMLIDPSEAPTPMVVTRVSESDSRPPETPSNDEVSTPAAEPKTKKKATRRRAPRKKPPPKKKVPVAVVAAAAGVLAIGGAAAAVKLSGGNGAGAAADSVFVANADVTGDTAKPLATRDNQSATRPPVQPTTTRPQPDVTQPIARPPTPPTTTRDVAPAPVVATADSAVIHGELGIILDQVVLGDIAERARGMRAAQDIYSNVAVPANQRADAASYVAQGYYENANTTEACRWIGNARLLAPMRVTLSDIHQRWGCP